MADVPAAAETAFLRRSVTAGEILPRRTDDAEAARTAAEEFEAVFISQMLEHMFAGIRTDGPFGGGRGEEMFRSLMITEYGRMIARSGGVGVADQVMAEILRIQDVQADEGPAGNEGSDGQG